MGNWSNEVLVPIDNQNKNLFYLHKFIVSSRRNSNVKGTDKPLNFDKDIRQYVNQNIDDILIELDLRWIAALLNTYIDSSDDEKEKLYSMILVSLIQLIQGTTSHLYHYGVFEDDTDIDKSQDLIDKHTSYTFMFGGLHCKPGTDNLWKDLFTRMFNLMKGNIIFFKIFKKVMEDILQENTSLIPSTEWAGVKLKKQINDIFKGDL